MKRVTAKLVAGVLISAIGLIPNLGAQTTQADWNALKALTAGTQVRITDGSRTVDGKLDRTTDDGIMVTSGRVQEKFDRRDVSIVSVKKQSHRKRNTLIGLGVGAGGGLAFGGALANERVLGFLGGHRPAIIASSGRAPSWEFLWARSSLAVVGGKSTRNSTVG
ncbi:MAG: hypothetical protein DMG57_07140 [Acidobacteria bacterium]|nr:MAG: hypothetical protein DMG57_07140 [Acidobacteriota bacterium]